MPEDLKDVQKHNDKQTATDNSVRKFLFKSVELQPIRKGIYKDAALDTVGYRLVKAKNPRKWDIYGDNVAHNYGKFKDEECEKQLVFGWANVTVDIDGQPPLDWQNDIIKSEELEAAAYNYVLNWGIAGIEHDMNPEYGWNTECGWLVESIMFTKEKMQALGIPEGAIPEGWWVGFYVPDPDVFQKVKDGEFNMFSIQGYATRVPAGTEETN